MTVLEICAYAAPYEGNFIRSLKALAQTMAEAQFVFAFPSNAAKLPWVKELSKTYDVFFLPLSKARLRPSTYLQLRKIYKKYPDIKIVHSHFELYDVPVSLTAPKTCSVFWHLHDAIEIYQDFRSRLIHKVQYGILHGKAKLVSVSVRHRDYAVRLGFPVKQTICCPNGLDTRRIRQVSAPYSSRRFDFLIFGWDYYRKGVDLCIAACRQLQQPLKVGLVMSGEEYRRITEAEEIPDCIERIDPVPDVNELYSASRCFLHISRAEGHSYALLEAIYAGLPIICSDISENAFAFEFPCVKTVQAGNTEQLTEAMRQALHAGDITDGQKASCRALIEESYSLEAWTRKMKDIYEAE